jgi:hypothetical protein
VANAVTRTRCTGSVADNRRKSGDQGADRGSNMTKGGGEARAARGRGGGGGHERFERKSVKNLSCKRIDHETMSREKVDSEDRL